MRNGLHLPKAAAVAVPAYSAHRDPSYYDDPNTYDAFRFSRPFEIFEASKSATAMQAKQSHDGTLQDRKEDLSKFLEHKKMSAITTGEHFMQFGHGRHACPGRFFAIQELKLLIAHMVLHYDIEPLATRPSNIWMGGLVFPPMKASVRIKRRPPVTTKT